MTQYGAGAVSVVIVTWNRRDLLRNCLQSLRLQQFKEPFEVIVVDNGSRDGSPEMVLQEFSNDPAFRLKLIRNENNLGFCVANNQGIAVSSAGLIALLNNDAEAEPGWLAALACAFENRADIGMAASKILVHEGPHRMARLFQMRTHASGIGNETWVFTARISLVYKGFTASIEVTL